MHPSGVAKSSTSLGWGKGWNVISAGWQVTLCDPIWHVSSSSGVATSVSELLYPCYFTLLYFTHNTPRCGRNGTPPLQIASRKQQARRFDRCRGMSSPGCVRWACSWALPRISHSHKSLSTEIFFSINRFSFIFVLTSFFVVSSLLIVSYIRPSADVNPKLYYTPNAA